jgi:ketosteroid isomerase-like protein
MADDKDLLIAKEEAEKRTELYIEAFNKGDVDSVNSMYTDEAIVIWEPGKPVGGADRPEYVRGFLSLGPKMRAEVKHNYATSDTALLVVDWKMSIPANGDQEAQELSGLALDVLRKGEDGIWRYAIDHPYGAEN